MDAIDLAFYRRQGHLTVNGVFSAAETDALIADVEAWGETFLGDLPAEQRGWYIDGGVKARTVLRKLDNPHAHRPAVQEVARDPRLVALVEQVLGAGVSVYFSQIFFKAPEGGGPKQLPPAVLDKQPMAPAPVRKGGVSFHHGNTFHQSGPNQSTRWRRACALHYVRNGVEFATPALPYDHSLKMRIT